MKQVQTVLGPVPTSKLGKTLTHEHFSLDFDHFYCAPPEQLKTFLADKIELKNVGYVRQYPYGNRYNINFCDADTHRVVIDEIHMYRRFGGGSIVENTSHGLKRNLKLCMEIAKSSGVNIIAGTGHYVAGVQSAETLAMSVEDMEKLYVEELMERCNDYIDEGGLNVRCGFIGEVGSGWPINGMCFYR